MSFAFRCMYCEITMDRPFGTCDTCAKMLDPTYQPYIKPQCTLYVLKNDRWTQVYKDNKAEILKIASNMTDTYKVVNHHGDIIARGERSEER